MEHWTLQLAHDRTAALRADASRQRLARLVTCCRPSTWRRALRDLDARVRGSRYCCV